MLRTDKPIYKVILILNLLFIAAGLVFCVMDICLSADKIYRVAASVLKIVALGFATYYIFEGYEKDAAKYYKSFGICFILAQIASLIGTILDDVRLSDAKMFTIIPALVLICLLILVFAKNLRKAGSLVLCGILVVLNVITICSLEIWSAEATFIVLYGTIFSRLLLACLYGIMTYAKYLDKAERGTK